MEQFWTSKYPINGLRHFVLLNREKEGGQIIFLMVSVIDVEINLRITREELFNSLNWEKGWINLPKIESITEDYFEFKNIKKINFFKKVFVKDDSYFNIS